MKNLPLLKRPDVWNQISLQKKKYFVLTLHRPSNVDELGSFSELLKLIVKKSKGIPIVFPVHPRTQKILKNDFKALHLMLKTYSFWNHFRLNT